MMPDFRTTQSADLLWCIARGDECPWRCVRFLYRGTVRSTMQPLNIPPNFDITVRVGCSLVYEVTGTASLLLNLKPRPDATTPCCSRR